jgi:hypothetical protein
MKQSGYKRISFIIVLLLILFGYTPLQCQEVKTNRVEFFLNNTPDTEPPEIRIITPVMGEGFHFITDTEEIELIGEIRDESAIKFLSVNLEMKSVNEAGVFSSILRLYPGENRFRMLASDIHDNIKEQFIIIEYEPPIVTLEDRINRDAKYYGLIIGIEKYRDQGIDDLEFPVEDAEKFYDVLTTRYTFDPDNVQFLKNPRRSDIISALDELRAMVTPEDNLLIFYAGHGYWEKEGEIGYWLPSDARRNSTVDWFRNSTLVAILQAINSKHTLLITDACFAGSIFSARSVSMEVDLAYEKIYDMRSRRAMTSGTLTEVPDKSAFIKYLIQYLEGNEEVYLSSAELFTGIRVAVTSNSKVAPRYGEILNVGNEGGDFIFLKRTE